MEAKRARGYGSVTYKLDPGKRYRVPGDIPYEVAAQALRDGFGTKAVGRPHTDQKNAAQAD